ncbi:MAG: hypothetical protein ACI80V_000234 [Rhodothermales bacterium]|jgi:hypothetical protein
MNTSPTAPQMRLIRFALLLGILIWGAVAAFLASSAGLTVGLNAPGPLASVVAFLVVAAAGALLYIRRLLEDEEDFSRRTRLLIIGHVTCEISALFGGVHLITTGGLLPYAAGLTVFLFSFILLPVEKV